MSNSSIVSVSCGVDFETFRDFSKLNFRKNFKAIFKNTVLMVIFLFSTIILFNFLFRVPLKNFIDNLIYFTFGVAAILFFTFFRQRPKAQFKKIFKNRDITYDYHFLKDSVKIEVDNTGAKSTVPLKYENLATVYETQHGFFLYTTEKNLYMLSKKELDKKSMAEVRNIFKEKLGTKFEMVTKL